MKICFGIISWLPDQPDAREMRIDRLNRLLEQIAGYWPDIPVLIVAQNWQDYKPSVNLNIFVEHYPCLGILKARQQLRDNFLATDYDYIIMFDDDAIIQCDTEEAAQEYIRTIEEHPDCFAFIDGKGSSPFTPYADSQLNLCAISRSIYKENPIPNVDPQQSHAFEDRLFSTYLHCVMPEREFHFLPNIRCIHFKNPNEPAPSTWSRERKYNWRKMRENTVAIEAFIATHKKYPNFRNYF